MSIRTDEFILSYKLIALSVLYDIHAMCVSLTDLPQKLIYIVPEVCNV